MSKQASRQKRHRLIDQGKLKEHLREQSRAEHNVARKTGTQGPECQTNESHPRDSEKSHKHRS